MTNHRGLLLTLICIPIFIGALDLTVVSAVLPHVIFDLEIPIQTGLDEAAWVVTGYLLAYSVAMTFMGRLSDLYGRLRVYLIALAVFAFGSYLVAVADEWPARLLQRATILAAGGRPDPSFTALRALIGARMIQAFGGGAMVPVGMALVGDLYPAGRRARPLGLIAAVDTAGWVVGHLYGGIVVRFFDWRTIFWLNLPVCLAAFALILWASRGLAERRREGRMDWAGAILISAALAALSAGLGTNVEAGGTAGELPPYAVSLIVTAVTCAVLFVLWETRARDPLVPLGLFRLPNFSAASAANFLTGFGLFVAIANVPLFINSLFAETLEQGAWDSGWMLSALTIPMALAAVPGGAWAARSGYRLPSIIGLAGAVGGLLLMQSWGLTTTYSQMVPHLVLAGIGFGLLIAPIAAAAVDAAPESHRGTASALVIIFRLIGMTIGVSSLTTYGVHRIGALSRSMVETGASLDEVVRIGMEIAAQVIGETFVIAALVCALAAAPVLLLKSYNRKN
ncbi:MAG TPA: MFS transporter [Anaerolineales bacterium]|nr:MFS transporter [Anaerolineales bacterium]